MIKKLLILSALFLPAVVFAAVPVSWTLKNPSDAFYYANPMNGVSKGALIGTSTMPADIVMGDLFRVEGQSNDFIDAGSIFQGRRARGTNLLPTAPLANDSLALIGGDAYGSSGFHNSSLGALAIKAESNGCTNTSCAVYAALFTSPTTTVTALERMRITSFGDVGIGSTSPFANFVVQANPFDSDIDTTLFIIASSTATATTTIFRIDNVGHQFASSTNPALTSCGTGPTMLGSDHHGTVTAGATANGCVITFGQAYPLAPTCVVSNQSMSVINAMTYTVSATAMTITETGLGGAKFDYICYGN